MKKLRRFFLWSGLLLKRLLRRPAYLAVLLLVPLFALAITLFSRINNPNRPHVFLYYKTTPIFRASTR